ncbi:hypothetical protein MNBD_GAMMA24-319 [hydrothermal vent metagenome]|uniref:SET domain-containing protein n=1 Tax=hydrothermal vent metagenome TaxID=652676 RepID=A0A3B1B1C4_9ZZZZ
MPKIQKRSNNPLVSVSSSSIHGKGLFAKKPIRAGQLIGIAKGQLTNTDGPHVLWLSEKQGFEVHCYLRYINHDDHPNAAYYETLEVCALRDIAPGEEITHNYGW